jgi:uroporphyrinogen-III decarboxylase
VSRRHAEPVRVEPDTSRTQDILERIGAAYRHEPVDHVPVLVGDVNYWITGEDPALIPPDYFDEGAYAVQLEFQTSKMAVHLTDLADDLYQPFLFPWYGTGVVPSALGCRILFATGEEPAVEGGLIDEPAAVARLEPPDPAHDGLMPRVLACIDHFRAHSDLPVSFTDNQGPLNIALNLVGLERLCLWMFEQPTAVHELMDFCTSVLIDWVRLQKQRAGVPLESGAFPHMIAIPPGFGGVWLSDDDSTVLSPPLYREFVVPYNGRVFEAFGGGTLHYCGNGRHQLENYLATPGLVGLNVWCMGEFEQIFEAQRIIGDRAAIMVCDYTPTDPEAYFSDLFAGLDRRGAIVATYPSAVTALEYGSGQVRPVQRDSHATGLAAWEVIGRLDQRGAR